MAHILEEFVSVMAIYDRSLLDKDPSLHLGLTDDLRIAYTNDAWETFARQNGGEHNVAD